MALQFDNSLIKRSLESLINQCEKDPQLSKDSNVHMIINTQKRIGVKNDFIPRIIPLSHCKFDRYTDLRILLIVKDPSSLYHSALSQNEFTATIFKTIISVKKLKSRYRGSKLNTLFQDYDLIVADYRVHHLLPPILGSKFYNSNKKLPFMVQMSKQVKIKGQKMKDECDPIYLRAQIKSICKNTWYVPNPDNCLSVKIGQIGRHSIEEITHNIKDVVNFLTDKRKKPQGGIINGTINSLFLKTSNSVSLPIYRAVKKTNESEYEEICL